MKAKYLLLLIFFCNTAYLFSFGTTYNENAKIKNAAIEVKKQENIDDKFLLLDGEWEFYWKQLLENNEIENEKFENKQLVYLPQSWNTLEKDEKTYPSPGYATYRLRIINNSGEDIGIRISKIFTASKVFINDKLKHEVGKVSKTRAGYSEDTRYKNIFVEKDLKEFYLIVQVSNFNDNTGGIWESIILGTRENIQSLTYKRYILESFVFGILLIIGIYHMIFYFKHRDEKTFLIFGIFCLLMSARVSCIGELIIRDIFPLVNWIVMRKIEFFIFYVVVPLFLLFLYTLYPKEINKKTVIAVGSLGGVFGLIVLFFDNGQYTKLVGFYQIVTISVSLYSFKVLVHAYIRKREGALLLIVGGAVLFYTVVNDILFNKGVIKSINLFPLGIVFFIIMYSIVLAVKFKKVRDNGIENEKKMEIEKEKSKNLEILKEFNEKSLNKLKILQQFSVLIYKEKNINKVIYYILNFLMYQLNFRYEKGRYFKYSDKNKSFMLNQKIDYLENKKLPKELMHLIEDIEKEYYTDEIVENISLDLSKSKILSDIFNERKCCFYAIEDIDDKELLKLQSNNMVFCPIIYDEKYYGIIVLEKEETAMKLEAEEIEILKIITNSLGLYIEKIFIESQNFDMEPRNELRCKKCKKKLLVYKGEADFVEIKCPYCNTKNSLD